MNAPAPAINQHLQQAVGLLMAGRAHEAAQLLTAVTTAQPGLSVAHRLLGEAQSAMGDLTLAEASMREAVRLAKRDPAALTGLGEVLTRKGALAEAEKVLRGALAAERRFTPAAAVLAPLLLGAGRDVEAMQVTGPLVIGDKADPALLQFHGQALRALGRMDDAIPYYQRAVASAPASGVAEHNLGSAHGDAEQHVEAEAAIRRAFQKGVDAPESWLVLARALLAQARYDEADAAFRQAIARRPSYDEAQRELAHLIWMRTGDLAQARALMDATIRTRPDEALIVSCSQLLDAAGEPEQAYELVAEAARQPTAGAVMLATAALRALAVDPDASVGFAQRVLAMLPDHPAALNAACAARLAVGDAAGAELLAEKMLAGAPDDQHALAFLATAWRLKGDSRYYELFDYGAFVRPFVIDTPPGWSSLDAYLADLTESLNALHGLETHPIGQSLRHGSQTSQSLKKLDDPAIQGFFQAIDGPIRRMMGGLGKGRDPVRRRNKGGYGVSGIWSVRLKSSGFHVNHVHPQGWFSSACYITVPKAVEAGGKEGWIKFGEPGTPTKPVLSPEHFVKPEPGLLVLFPSYMWHGTVPFTSDERRMTVAFDIVPG